MYLKQKKESSVLKIDNIKELNGHTFQSFTFEVKENIVLINNLKDEIKIEITYTENKIIKLIDKIYKQTGLKINLNKLDDRVILVYIQDMVLEKTLWSPI